MKNPIQPLMKDANGVVRFKGNAIVQHLLDTHATCDMNLLARMDFTDDDRQQFAQLIGYSLSGYGDLSYVDDRAYATAAEPNPNWCAGCSPDNCSGCGADPVESEPVAFRVGNSYERQDGTVAKIIGEGNQTVVDEDGCHYYNRPGDRGRVTGTAHDYSYLRNLVRHYTHKPAGVLAAQMKRIAELEAALKVALAALKDFDYDKRMEAIAKIEGVLK